jgi:hypothetical protein
VPSTYLSPEIMTRDLNDTKSTHALTGTALSGENGFAYHQ